MVDSGNVLQRSLECNQKATNTIFQYDTMAKLSELRDMSNDQMLAVMKEACSNLFRLRVQAQTERLEVPTEIARNRKLVARIKTLLREREMAAAGQK